MRSNNVIKNGKSRKSSDSFILILVIVLSIAAVYFVISAGSGAVAGKTKPMSVVPVQNTVTQTGTIQTSPFVLQQGNKFYIGCVGNSPAFISTANHPANTSGIYVNSDASQYAASQHLYCSKNVLINADTNTSITFPMPPPATNQTG